MVGMAYRATGINAQVTAQYAPAPTNSLRLILEQTLVFLTRFQLVAYS